MELKAIRLISEFMGWTTNTRINHWMDKDVEEYDINKLPERLSYINDGYINIKSAEFDKSWDWLMPVAYKIITQFPQYDDSEEIEKVLEAGMTYDIEEVYESVVIFIEWYNDNNLNENQVLGQSTII